MPKLDPIPNLGSQIERAIVALFIDAFGADVVAAKNISFYTSNDWKQRASPMVSVLAHKSSEEPTYSGNEEYYVTIEAKAQNENRATTVNSVADRIFLDWLIGVPVAALSQSANGGQDRKTTCTALNTLGRALATSGSAQDQANNADMAFFTVERVMSKGSTRATRDADDFVICETRHFLVAACPKNTD